MFGCDWWIFNSIVIPSKWIYFLKSQCTLFRWGEHVFHVCIKMFSCSQQCKNYKNQRSFCRVMITNVLPRFYESQCILLFDHAQPGPVPGTHVILLFCVRMLQLLICLNLVFFCSYIVDLGNIMAFCYDMLLLQFHRDSAVAVRWTESWQHCRNRRKLSRHKYHWFNDE